MKGIEPGWYVNKKDLTDVIEIGSDGRITRYTPRSYGRPPMDTIKRPGFFKDNYAKVLDIDAHSRQLNEELNKEVLRVRSAASKLSDFLNSHGPAVSPTLVREEPAGPTIGPADTGDRDDRNIKP